MDRNAVADRVAAYLERFSTSVKRKYGSKQRVVSSKNIDVLDDEMPLPPMFVMTVRWSDDGDIVVDTRGFTALEAWGILQRCADEVNSLIADPIVVFDDSDIEEYVDDDDDDCD